MNLQFDNQPFALALDTEAIIHNARHHLDRLWLLARDACKETPDHCLDRGELKSAIDDAVHDVQQALYTAETYVENFFDWVREVHELRDTLSGGETVDAIRSPDSGVVPAATRCVEASP